MPVLVTTGALLTGGCASAASGAPAADTAATTSALATARGGTVHLVDYSVDSDGPRSSAIVTGAIGDYGPAVTVHPNGTIDPDHTSELRLDLRKGTFRLNIADLDQKIVHAYNPWPGNAATCSGSVGFTVATPVVPGSGTGSYRGISGDFELTVTIDEVDKPPVCNGESPFVSQIILISGAGTVSFH